MECGINRGEVSSGNASSADMVQMYLNTNARSTASVVSVPSELFKVSETYTIALTATNYLNISGKGSVSVTIANGSVPQIRLYANTPIVYRSQELMFTAIARLSPCCKLFNQTAEYSWRVYDGYRLSNALSSSSLDPRVFRLAAYSLDPGWNYTFRATVVFNSPSSTGISASSSFRVIVGVKGSFATIRGGYSQTFDISQSIVLDATGSYDIDDPTNKTLTFRWSCSVFSPNLGAQCTGFVAGSGNI